MQQAIDETYPFPADVVLRAFTSETFHRQKMEFAAHGTAGEVVGSGSDGSRFWFQVVRKLPLRVPGLRLGELTLHTEESWNRDSGVGSIAVDIRSMPISIRGRARIDDCESGSTVSCQWTIEASIPLVGRQVEKAIAAQLAKSSQQEVARTLELFRPYASA